MVVYGSDVSTGDIYIAVVADEERQSAFETLLGGCF